MTIQCPITVTVTAPAPVTPTISAACAAWIATSRIDLNAVTSDDVFAAFSAVNSGVIDYACGQVIAAAYQAPPAPPAAYSCGVFIQNYADFQIYSNGLGMFCIIPATYRNLPIWYGFTSLSEAVATIQTYFNTQYWGG